MPLISESDVLVGITHYACVGGGQPSLWKIGFGSLFVLYISP